MLLKFDPLLGVPVPSGNFAANTISEEPDEEELLENERETDLREFLVEDREDEGAPPQVVRKEEQQKRTPEKETCDEKMSLVISNAMKDITIEDKLNAENHIMR